MRALRRLIPLVACVAALAALTVAVRAYSTFAKWGSSPVPFYVNPANADGLSAAAVQGALDTAMNAWTSHPGSPFAFQYAGTVSDTTHAYDSRNVVLFRNQSNGSTIATTYSWYTSGTNLLLDSDVVFWDGGFTLFTGTSGCSSGIFIEDVGAHEFGHALGLGHSNVSGATMYPTYSLCSQSARTLAADDVAGLEFLYPGSSEPPPPPPPPTGAVLTARAYKVKGLQKVDLEWSGLSATGVDVLRNSVPVITNTANDGAQTDPINKKGGGTYTYQVCVTGGTTTCTNQVTVTF